MYTYNEKRNMIKDRVAFRIASLLLLCFKLFCWCEATKIFLSFPDKSF